MGRKISNVIIALVFVLGLGLLLYPTVSDLYNSYVSSKVVTEYTDAAASLTEEEKNAEFALAYKYNDSLRQEIYGETEEIDYDSVLNITGNGVMGYVTIPKINVRLPIYHNTAGDAGLLNGAEHLDGSSLPVGGESTHSVIYAHRGLPSAKLFTNLDQLEIGDTFNVTVLGETMTYQVDQILVVEPDDTSALEIVDGEDYCTLLTCTPYGVNTHRLLVRGTHIETSETDIGGMGYYMDFITALSLICVGVFVALFALFVASRARRSRNAKMVKETGAQHAEQPRRKRKES